MGFLDKPRRYLPLAPDIHRGYCKECEKNTKQSFKAGKCQGGVWREWTCMECGYVEKVS